MYVKYGKTGITRCGRDKRKIEEVRSGIRIYFEPHLRQSWSIWSAPGPELVVAGVVALGQWTGVFLALYAPIVLIRAARAPSPEAARRTLRMFVLVALFYWLFRTLFGLVPITPAMLDQYWPKNLHLPPPPTQPQ